MVRMPHISKVKQSLPSKDIEANLNIGPTFVQFDVFGGAKVSGHGSLTGDELAGLAMINEILRRLRTGKLLTYDFDPIALTNDQEIVLCEWLKSGNLKINTTADGNYYHPPRRWQHADTIEDATTRDRSFSCTLALAMLLPKRRSR